MRILAWNCRGLARPAAVRTLRRLIRDQSPDILFLSKTKISPQVSATLNRLGFFLVSQVVATGINGGLVLSWRLGIELECFVLNKNISAWCYSDPPTFPWILSCVYGPSNRCDRRAFWDSFAVIGESFEAFWLCIGDFNSILVQSEKQGGRPVAGSSHCPFKSFIDHFGMIDLGFARNPFTWSNNK
jgi:hypothetical protein